MGKRQAIKITTREQARELFASIDHVIFDCDGVLYLEAIVIPGAPDAIKFLRSLGKKVIFATNNSTKTRDGFKKKLDSMDFKPTTEEVFTTSYASGVYLKDKFKERIGDNRKLVYLMGSPAMEEELNAVGIKAIGTGPDPTTEGWDLGTVPWQPNPEVGAVLIGFDRFLSYPKLVKAVTYAAHRDILFVATNTDETFPTPVPNITMPGTGTLVKAVEAGAQRPPDAILGKPHKFFFDCIRSAFPGLEPSRTLMVGDRLSTDIRFGNQNGMKTLLVLTGISKLDDVKAAEANSDDLSVPTYYIPSLADVFKLLN